MGGILINPYRYVAAGGGGSDPTFGALGTISSSGETVVNPQTTTLTGISAGDLVLAFVQRVEQNNCTAVLGAEAMTLLKRSDEGASPPFAFDVWGVIAGSSYASAVITVAYGGNAGGWGTISSARYSGVGSATPLASSCNSSGCTGLATSATDRLAQSITTSQRSLLIAAGCDWNDLRTHTAASGWTKRMDGSGTPVTNIQFLHDRVADAGTYGGATAFATIPVADQYLSVLLAFSIAA